MPKTPKDNYDFQTTKCASKIFTDREEYKAVFWETYHNFKENIDKGTKYDITIITYYGIGGNGKTSLLDALKDEINEHNDMPIPAKEDILSEHYDLKYDFNKRSVMERIRKLLIDQYQFLFPIFDPSSEIGASFSASKRNLHKSIKSTNARFPIFFEA